MSKIKYAYLVKICKEGNYSYVVYSNRSDMLKAFYFLQFKEIAQETIVKEIAVISKNTGRYRIRNYQKLSMVLEVRRIPIDLLEIKKLKEVFSDNVE